MVMGHQFYLKVIQAFSSYPENIESYQAALPTAHLTVTEKSQGRS